MASNRTSRSRANCSNGPEINENDDNEIHADEPHAEEESIHEDAEVMCGVFYRINRRLYRDYRFNISEGSRCGWCPFNAELRTRAIGQRLPSTYRRGVKVLQAIHPTTVLETIRTTTTSRKRTVESIKNCLPFRV